MEYLQNNKLIARFMGWDVFSNGCYNFEGEIYTSLPNYESDWNALMSVVDKISKTPNFEYPDGMYAHVVFIEIEGIGNCKIYSPYDCSSLTPISNYESTMLVNVYNSVVEFIKWYNENR